MTRKKSGSSEKKQTAQKKSPEAQQGKPPRRIEATSSLISSEERVEMIRQNAYSRAARRDFRPGHEKEDWFAAEQEVDARLSGADLPPPRLLAELARERDELRLKMHLASLEVRDEWDDLEKKWRQIRRYSGDIADEALGAGKNIGAAAGDLLGEIQRGYRHIRDAF